MDYWTQDHEDELTAFGYKEGTDAAVVITVAVGKLKDELISKHLPMARIMPTTLDNEDAKGMAVLHKNAVDGVVRPEYEIKPAP
jgi:hypothetical protein